MRCSLGSLFQGAAYGPLNTVIADLPWGSRPHLVTQTNNPLGDKTIPPHSHGETCGAQLGGHRGVALPAGALQNDARAKRPAIANSAVAAAPAAKLFSALG